MKCRVHGLFSAAPLETHRSAQDKLSVIIVVSILNRIWCCGLKSRELRILYLLLRVMLRHNACITIQNF